MSAAPRGVALKRAGKAAGVSIVATMWSELGRPPTVEEVVSAWAVGLTMWAEDVSRGKPELFEAIAAEHRRVSETLGSAPIGAMRMSARATHPEASA